MKTLVTAAVAAAVVLAMPAAPAARDGRAPAQEKIRIALWDFENHAEQRYWFHSDLGPAARNQIDNAFSENAKLRELFTVIERERLDMVMQEQGLATAGALDPQTAARVGQILGVRYIVTGGIDKFAINTTSGRIGGIVGGRSTSADAEISMRFIDATTAERVISVSAEGTVQKGGGFVRGVSLNREDEWGIASEAIQKAAEEVVQELVDGGQLDTLSAAAGTGGIDMRIVRVDGTRAYINVGAAAGIKVGDKFKIFSKGEDLIDPATGMNLGAVETETGSGVVVEVQDRFAIIELTGTAKEADVIRKEG
jgi:curli biogenesis system outer membrane secretion channel CsgG